MSNKYGAFFEAHSRVAWKETIQVFSGQLTVSVKCTGLSGLVTELNVFDITRGILVEMGVTAIYRV